ncbi:MAG TPA: glucose-1-phosphate adenylyltransferase [Acidobacteriota bacterium]|nr:glucose-1-phosphate adenylyltransferase [Acidobacteriota bacterium]
MLTLPSVRKTLVCLLAGGQGERLFPLTRDRAKPAVPFGGVYRIIDITLSNCINSELRRIFVLTQYKALSLNRHIRKAWGMLPSELGEYIQVLPPMMRVGEHWYRGTADAIYQNLYSVGAEACRYIVILAGDHVYKMNYQLMLRQHIDAGAELTIGTIESTRAEASRFGVCEIGSDGRIIGWQEKPAEPKVCESACCSGSKCQISMGIYCFNRDLLMDTLMADAEDPSSSHDFGKDIVSKLIDKHRVYAYRFIDENQKEAQYWRDIGTIEAYYEANMDLVSVTPIFNLYDARWPLRTYQGQYPPAKFVFADQHRMGMALDSIVSMGSIISGGRVRNSVLSPDVRVDNYSEVDSCIVFSHVKIGRHCRIRRAIIDRHVQILDHCEIGFNLEEDRKKHYVTETGIVVVVPERRLFEDQ